MIYITINQAIEVHGITVDVSGGGAKGHLDLGKLESVLFHIQNDDYYPELVDKLTHLFFATCNFHCFVDGNKRIAISLCAQFLLLNGYVFIVPEFIRKMENISYHVAAGKINKGLLHEIMEATLSGNDENEELKIKIWHAISDDYNEEMEK
ncbi:MAG: Fic family protein [Tissierellia bacterium]|nr:Fic family protein [Tissierellia bacterium]